MPSRLSIQRPSPTTVLFTVSNAPARSTITARLLFYLRVVLRILAFAFALLVNAAKVRHSVLPRDGVIPWANVWSSTIGSSACRIVDGYNWQFVCIGTGLVMFAVFRKGYTEESLLVIRGLGVQTSTSSASYFATASTRFIPTTQIQDIVIHEAFKGFEVRFYLAIIVEGEADAVVVFPNLLPQRLILENVWRGARKCLYDPKS
ncbi:hypothetical protein AJ80_07335 [Polytolypa hystricis UAMH7299]|uniref:Phosphatidylinositol N-acetylglucosaminyltransferase subunit H conserved domain-containing protein n=1 Tax=Polytolypa hystricis (strain UAMH7299) TaxID=1447883 RepID=A0A2B7XQH7_POLH7|nr:hypothetical protein AJ80_07335 [Polytolypa hystricis UAMH7299]